MTGGRIKRLQYHLKDQTFLLTYGDGLSDVNINNLLNFHKKSKNLVTLTAVRPPARFGYLKLKGNSVKYFKEKSKTDEGWINGGFFIIEPKFLKNIKKQANHKLTLSKKQMDFVTKIYNQCKKNIEKNKNKS